LDPDINCVDHLKSEELGGEVLTTKTSVSYLGCILDGSLGGVNMANKVLGKVNAKTNFLARKSKLLDKDSVKVLAIQHSFNAILTMLVLPGLGAYLNV
jgi:hypothetical protein